MSWEGIHNITSFTSRLRGDEPDPAMSGSHRAEDNTR